MKARVLVGRNLRRLRVGRRLSQEALGHAAECEPSYIGRIERGQENVGVDLLEAIAAALSAEIAELFALPGGELLPGLPAGRKPKAASVGGKSAAARGLKANAPTSAAPATASASPPADKPVEGA